MQRNELRSNDLPDVDIFRALSESSRLRIVAALDTHELCVCQLVELLGLATSTVSKHLSVLRASGLVQSSQKGKWVFYRLASFAARSLERSVMTALLEDASRSRWATSDRKRLKQILCVDPISLCERHRS